MRLRAKSEGSLLEAGSGFRVSGFRVVGSGLRFLGRGSTKQKDLVRLELRAQTVCFQAFGRCCCGFGAG